MNTTENNNTPPNIPPRPHNAHKGTCGTVAVLGACAARQPQPLTMLGGPVLTARAALRAGAGLAKLLLPDTLTTNALTALAEATAIPLPTNSAGHIDTQTALPILDNTLRSLNPSTRSTAGIGVLAIGPGLGPPTEHTRALVMRAITQDHAPIVIDADALNALATIPSPNLDFHAHAIITPHPGEARTLADAFNLSIKPTADNDDERHNAAQTLAAHLGCICILKSHRTTIASPVEALTLDAEPNPALATAGAGDVLTGVVAACIAQFVRPALLMGEHSRASQDLGGLSLLDAAHTATNIHATAARLWANATTPPRHAGLLASELTDHLPLAIATLRDPARIAPHAVPKH